jgi:hypothetical protein
MPNVKAIIEIDSGEFFDAVVRVGQAAAGERLLQTVLSISSGGTSLLEKTALSLYGITISPYESPATATQRDEGECNGR